MASTVSANNGVALPIDSLEILYGYTGSNLTTMTTTYAGLTYVKTFTYVGSNCTSSSQWEVQS